MNILYLLYREDLYSPIVRTQVIDVLTTIYKKHPSIKIHIIWLKRIDYWLRNKEQINLSKRIITSTGLFYSELPIIVGRFPINQSMSAFVYNQVYNRIHNCIVDENIDIVHTRGYNSGLVAAKIKNENNIFSHIWDPRSPYLSELVSTYNLEPQSKTYRFWENAEDYIIRNSDATISTSIPFLRYLKKRSSPTIYIPNNVQMETPDTVITRANTYRRNSICYVGSLSHGWNNIDVYIAFMNSVMSIDSTIHFEMYIISEHVLSVKKTFHKEGIPTTVFSIYTLPPDEIGHAISGCMAGMQIMPSKDPRLGIKTAEYLAAGVPIICNSNAVGASELVNETQCGWNIDITDLKTIIQQAQLHTKTERCVKYAYANLSTDTISNKYYEAYKKLNY